MYRVLDDIAVSDMAEMDPVVKINQDSNSMFYDSLLSICSKNNR